jgi:hypothetical protein
LFQQKLDINYHEMLYKWRINTNVKFNIFTFFKCKN